MIGPTPVVTEPVSVTGPTGASRSVRRLRSAEWFAAPGRQGFVHRTHVHQLGRPADTFDGSRPVVAVASTWSEFTPCNSGLRSLAEAVKRGVWESGGVPYEMPLMSLGEPLMRPTTMLYRNLLAMETEELLRANPVDAVVLLGGCDKTVPGMLMGAASVDLPAVVVTTGPMLDGELCGQPIGSGTDVWRLTESFRDGTITASHLSDAEAGMSRSPGHCMTMGTASTMGCLVEALGMTLPGGASIPATDSRRQAMAQQAGRRAVTMALNGGPRVSEVLTRSAFENAIVVHAVIGGSTNAVLHLLAIAGRLGVDLTLDDFDHLGRDLPLLVDLKPAGRFLMAQFAAAGGVAAVLAELLRARRLDGTVRSVSGATLAAGSADAPCWDSSVIASFDSPVQPLSRTAVLRGNIVPSGALLKTSAATPSLLVHRGPARVFDSIEEYLAVVDDTQLDVTPDTVLVVRYLGPVGYPGMPELGNLPIPLALTALGVTDMVRISDARMSGTAYGTVVLHAAPEAAIGGPIALVRSGDVIELDVDRGRLELDVDDVELDRRRRKWTPPTFARRDERGWIRLYREHVMQADTGCDLDFLRGASGDYVPRRSV